MRSSPKEKILVSLALVIGQPEVSGVVTRRLGIEVIKILEKRFS